MGSWGRASRPDLASDAEEFEILHLENPYWVGRGSPQALSIFARLDGTVTVRDDWGEMEEFA